MIPDYHTYTMGQLIRRRSEIKESKSSLNEQLKAFNEEESLVDSALIKQLEAAQSNKASSPEGYGSVTLSEDTVAEVLDWDEFHHHILETGDFSLLQRRVSVTSFREAINLQGAIPGLAPRTIKKINHRSS